MTDTVLDPDQADRVKAAFAMIADAFAELGRVIRAVWQNLVTALRPYARWFRRYGRGYSSPPPLGMNGHAYFRRRRARIRNKSWHR